MNISTRAKALVGAVAIGGAAVAMGGAFTGPGVTSNFTSATNDPTFVGGEASVALDGATLTDIAYDIDDTTSDLTGVQLTFTEDLTGKTVDVELLNGSTSVSTPSCSVNTTVTTCVVDPAIESNTFDTLSVQVTTTSTYTPAV